MDNKKKVCIGRLVDYIALAVSFIYIIASCALFILFINHDNSDFKPWAFQSAAIGACYIFLIVFICVNFAISAKSENKVNVVTIALKILFAILAFVGNLLSYIELVFYYPGNGLGFLPKVILFFCILMLVYILINIFLLTKNNPDEQKQKAE